MKTSAKRPFVEWPTFALIIACYAGWLVALWVLPLWAGIVFAGVMIALHSSLQHEVLHGHPFRSQALSDAVIWPPLTLVIPYARFVDTHLAHHQNENLTDPYDDPETAYLDPAVWERLPLWVRWVMNLNNTLAGRLLLGPLVGTVAFGIAEWSSDDPRVRRGWLLHIPAVAIVLLVVWLSPMALWAYALAAYLGMSILKLRTYLEHQAHERASGRSVIVERGGIFGFLFLNNNLHVVHHMHPKVPWYRLPSLFRSKKDHYLRRNGGYYYRSYNEIFRRFLFKAKEPVPHPLWRR